MSGAALGGRMMMSSPTRGVNRRHPAGLYLARPYLAAEQGKPYQPLGSFDAAAAGKKLQTPPSGCGMGMARTMKS